MKEKMVHVRLSLEIYKKLSHICIEKETSIQKFVEGLIVNSIEEKNNDN